MNGGMSAIGGIHATPPEVLVPQRFVKIGGAWGGRWGKHSTGQHCPKPWPLVRWERGKNSPVLGGKRQDKPDPPMLCWMLALARNGCLAH